MRWRATRPRWLITWRGAWRRAPASRGNRASWGRTPVLRPTVHVGLFPLRSGSWRTRADLESRPTLLPCNAEIVEVRDAVGFGPQANLAGLAERGVQHLEQAPVIEIDAEQRTPKLHLQHAPLIQRHGMFHAEAFRRRASRLERRALSVLNLVQDDAVLQRVGAHDVVVVRIAVAEHQPSGAILLARHRLHLDA